MGHRGRQKSRSRNNRRKGSSGHQRSSSGRRAGGAPRSQHRLEGGLGIVLIGFILLMILAVVIARIFL